MLRRPLCALGRPSALALLPRACRVAPRALAIHPRAAAVAPCRQLHSSLRAKEAPATNCMCTWLFSARGYRAGG
ncbi:hypothetical protein EMIHUDRAFT_257991 [Emiliania huxleyi CCMP1516]|uniref:Uncharacterized protein n=2 Tax=Emiliania huxleyi TaxID=2903 RepID=A0A0D3IEI2_EMIH1|nr:hypothetical protein EMIHUDRAFT_257991 [Emiliania huxleyi CCMP1516]EOD09667.1 hypothetical protein EMIHUDRAFT_257991 [Emiliania huxleyi CCMP1516]|eukprot:XP_005762096.1 hypothetical protein EMIHUDRAFT_257991 [Emiliania huxleyi CCMP1516]